MRTKTCVVLAAACLALTGGAVGQPAAEAAPHVGQSFLFDYGEMVVRVSYLSEKKLQWQQVRGPHTTWSSPEKKLAAFQGRITARN